MEERKPYRLGCIGDDFTGSSDAASFLAKSGMRTLLLNGIPESLPELDCDAIVIALKTRSIEKQEAVKSSMEALSWLGKRGFNHFYIKYCSTFDSTKDGNIGPIIDAAMEKYREAYTILCPALPVNKRMVKNGILWVDGIPLAESPMRNHPLNPMWASKLADLMEPQGKYECLPIAQAVLKEKSVHDLQCMAEAFGLGRDHFYVVPDYINEEDGKKIAAAFGELRILTGGSGILSHLAEKGRKDGRGVAAATVESAVTGRGIILAGSCSRATLEQIEFFHNAGGCSIKLDPIRLLRGEQSVEGIWSCIANHSQEEFLVYSSDQAEAIKENQKYGKEKIAALLEESLAMIGRRALESGCKRIIVAGGETSGAVTLALGFDAYMIGESVAPGVPIMVPVQRQDVRLVLKSGNFGQKDFFMRALEQTKG